MPIWTTICVIVASNTEGYHSSSGITTVSGETVLKQWKSKAASNFRPVIHGKNQGKAHKRLDFYIARTMHIYSNLLEIVTAKISQNLFLLVTFNHQDMLFCGKLDGDNWATDLVFWKRNDPSTSFFSYWTHLLDKWLWYCLNLALNNGCYNNIIAVLAVSCCCVKRGQGINMVSLKWMLIIYLLVTWTYNSEACTYMKPRRHLEH